MLWGGVLAVAVMAVYKICAPLPWCGFVLGSWLHFPAPSVSDMPLWNWCAHQWNVSGGDMHFLWAEAVGIRVDWQQRTSRSWGMVKLQDPMCLSSWLPCGKFPLSKEHQH